MKKGFLILLTLPFLFAFAANPTFEVKVLGSYLDAISGSSTERINLETLDLSRRSFGIGLEAETQAEIILYKGKVFKSSFGNDGITTQKDKRAIVSFIVYSDVKKWERLQLPSTIRSLQDLETEIARVIGEYKFSQAEPVPFLVIGNPISANWHIELVPGADRQLNNQGFFFQDLIKAVGFYSTNNQGTITSSNSRIHIHVTNKRKEIVGHLDDIKMSGGMTLWMPKLN